MNIYKVCAHRRHNPFFFFQITGKEKGPRYLDRHNLVLRACRGGNLTIWVDLGGRKIATEAKEVLAEIKGDDWRSGMRNPNGIFAGRDGRQR